MSSNPSGDSANRRLSILMKKIAEVLQPWQMTITTGLRQFAKQTAKVQGFVAQVAQALGEIGLIYQQYPLVMYYLGWPPVDCFTMDEQSRTVSKYHQQREQLVPLRAAIERTVLARYDDARLKAIVERWESRTLLARRLSILRPAVEAHIEGKYALSVPALLAQMEGVVADGFAHRGQMNGVQYKAYVGKLLSPELLRKHDEMVKDFMVEVILAGFKHGGPLPNSMSRHAILHGADTSYGTAATSLKVILLFDYLQGAFRLFGTPHGRAYHLLGCPALARTGPERVVFKSGFHAMQAGRQPCRRCHPLAW